MPSPPSLIRQLSTRVLVFDLAIAPALTLIWLSLVEIVDLAGICLLMLALFAARLLGWVLHLRWLLRPAAPYFTRGQACDDGELLRAAAALARYARPYVITYALGWVAYVVVPSLLGWLGLIEVVVVGRGELFVIAGLSIAIMAGAPMATAPIAELYTTPVRLRLADALERRGLSPQRSSSRMLHKLGLRALGLVIAPLALMTTLGFHFELRVAREHALASIEHQLANVGDASELTLTPDQRIVEADALPPGFGARTDLDVRHERVRSAVALPDGRWLLTERPVEGVSASFWASTLPAIAGVLVWSLFVIISMARSITAPIERMRELIHRIVDVGDLADIGRIPQLDDDEIGALTHDLNQLVVDLGHLAHSSRALAEGKLYMVVDGRGELADGFRRMTEQLHEILVEIRHMAVELATTAREILAATREQELAGEQQANGMHDLSASMAALARSAAQINAAVADVRTNAEQTFGTTDEVAAALAELDSRSRGVAELLDVIRDIAKRSDLLALNGSLEATRAGEAGRGFALVAAEMRRLAERVSGTVDDVGDLIGDISQASSGTSRATARSRDLAEDTTHAARRIAGETQRQSSETSHASEAVRELAGLVQQGSAATTQTRAAAEQLERQAQQLRRMLDRFELRRT